MCEGIAKDQRGWLANPIALLDVDAQVRVAFAPVTPEGPRTRRHMPPELSVFWPVCDQRAVVYVAGSLLRDLWPMAWNPDSVLSNVVQRATHEDPTERYQTLDDLEAAFIEAGGDRTRIREGKRLAAWTAAELGLGRMLSGEPSEALFHFKRALELDTDCRLAQWGCDEARAEGGRSRPSTVIVAPAWSEVGSEGARLESVRAFTEALQLYRSVDRITAPGPSLLLALARCYLALGNTGHAIDLSRRAAVIAPGDGEAAELEVRALLARAQYGDALARADAHLAARPDDASFMRYLRGRALFGLRRLVDARDAFDAVLTERPAMVEAMLLRREVDRMLVGVRTAAGVQDSTPRRDDHLAGARTMLIEGHSNDAIDELSKPSYADDPTARLMLADSLLAAKRGEEALAVYVRVAALLGEHHEAAVVGTAFALLVLGRHAEAVEMFARACRAWPANLDALEGYAQALQANGRVDDAEAAQRRATAARAARSDVRLRSLSPPR
jgi:tetratricopeptide (TPR) repeat protein